MIEVFVDWNCFQKGGIYRYFVEILPRISRHPDVHVNILGSASAVIAPPSTKDTQHIAKITPRGTWFPEGRVKRTLSQWRKRMDGYYWRSRIKRKKNALFHPTHYSVSPVPELPQMITIYDLIPEIFPQFTQARVFDELRKNKRRAISNACRILSISFTTKKDLCEFYDVPPEKVDVTPLAIDEGFFSQEIQEEEKRKLVAKFSLPQKPFFLYVGGRPQYKNFSNVLRAFSHGSFGKDFALVVAGMPWEAGEADQIKKLNLQDSVQLICHPNETELRALYQMAEAFIYPSLYEGFGLPVLEAMASGTPVIASRAGSIPEVAEEAALYFDPLEPSSIAKAIEQILEPEMAKDYISRGRTQVKKYSWDRTAAQTIEAYKKTLEI